MSEISFDKFWLCGKKSWLPKYLYFFSRYNFQERNMPLILEDIKKLRISNEDTLLDVGCGLGFFFNSIKGFL